MRFLLMLITAALCISFADAFETQNSKTSSRDDHRPAMTRWALDGGVALRLWDLSGEPAEQREYLEQSRIGSVLGVDVSVYPWERYGVGLTHSRFHATASDDDLAFPDNSRRPAKDDYTAHYVGPAFFVMHPMAGGRGALVGQAGMGWLFYRNESPLGAFPGIWEGTTLGLQAAISGDYRVLPWFGVGAGARFIHGTLQNVRYNAMETSIPTLSLTRIDLTAGVRFYP